MEVFPLPRDDDANSYDYPVMQYDHDGGVRAISGGYVYRGSIPSRLQGEYVFGDLVTGQIFHAPAAALNGSGQTPFEVLRLIDTADNQEKTLLEIVGGGTPAPRADLRFGIDDAGNIYLVTRQDGAIRMLVPIPESTTPSPLIQARVVSRRRVDEVSVTRASKVTLELEFTGWHHFRHRGSESPWKVPGGGWLTAERVSTATSFPQ